MSGLANITALSALVVLVLGLGWLLATGRLWTKGQIDYIAAQHEKLIKAKNDELDAAKAQSATDRETLVKMMGDLKAVLDQVLADRTAPVGRHGS